MEPERQDHEPETEIPPALARDLGRLWRHVAPIPREVDETVLAGARRRLEELRPTPAGAGRGLVLKIGSLAAAAALVAGIVFYETADRRLGPTESSPRVAQTDPLDVDRNGTVDIVDALVLAGRLGRDSRREWDFNGDGRVDEVDVDLIADRAVRLDR